MEAERCVVQRIGPYLCIEEGPDGAWVVDRKWEAEDGEPRSIGPYLTADAARYFAQALHSWRKDPAA